MGSCGIVGDNFDVAIETVREVNPELGFYEVDGRWIFPVYAQSGGLSHKRVIYLVRPSYWDAHKEQFIMPCLAVEYDDNASTLSKAAAKFDEMCKLVNPDGGDMGYPVKI